MAKLRNHTTLTKSPSKKAERWEVWRGWDVPNDHEESDIAGWSKRRRETDERTQRTVEAGRSVMTEKELYLCSLLHQCTALEDQASFKQASLAECFLPKPAPRPNKKPSPASDLHQDAAGQPEEANGASEDKKENGEGGPHITESNQLPSRAHRAKTAVLSSGDAAENERMPRCYSAGGCVHYKDGLGKNGYRDVSSATARAKRFIALSHSNSRASSSLRRQEEDQGEEDQGEEDIEITLDEDEDMVCKHCGCQQSDASQTTGNRTNRDTSPARCMAPPPAFRLSYSQSNITLQNPYTDPDPHVIDHDEDGADEGLGNTRQGTLLYKENSKGFNIRDSYLDSSGLIVSSLSELRKLAPPRSEQYTPRSQIYQVQESVDTKLGKSSGEVNNTTTDNSPQQTSSDSDDTKHNDKPSTEPAVCKCAQSSEAKKEPAKKQVSLILKKVSLQDAGEQQMTTVTSPMPVKFPNRTVSNQNTPQRGSNSSPQKTPETIDLGSKHTAQGPQKTPETIDPGSKHTAQDPEQSGQTVNHRIAILNAEVLPSNAPLVGSSTLTHSNSAPSLGGGHPTELGSSRGTSLGAGHSMELGSSRGTGLGAGHPMELGFSRGTSLGAVYSLQGLTPGLSAAMMTSSLVDLLPAVENNIRTRMVYRMDKNQEDDGEIYALDQDSLDRGLLVSRDNLVIRDNLISRELSRTLRSLDNQDQQLYTRDLSQEDNMYLLQDGLDSTRARDKPHAMLGPPAFRPQPNKTPLHRAKENSSKRIYSQFNYNNNNMMYSESRWQSSGGNLYQVAPGSRPVLNHLVEEVKSAPASYSWDQAVFPVTQQPATSNTPQPYTDKAAESSVSRLYKELPTNRDILRNKSTPEKQTSQGLAKLTLRGSCIEPSATHSNPDLDLVPPDTAVVKSLRQTAVSDVTCTQVSYNTYIVETTEARRIRISEHGDSYRDQQPTTWTPTTSHLPSSNKAQTRKWPA